MATAVDVAKAYDLRGKVYVVTGCSNGIGLACAEALLTSGATLVMACRPNARRDAAVERLRAVGGVLHSLDLDLGSPSSIEACVEAFQGLDLPLHALICNAGINGVPSWGGHTPGVETQFAVNYLGHYHLATLLDDKLRSTQGARLVIVSSESHRRVLAAGFDMARALPPKEEDYDDLHAYAFSNLCRIWWAKALAKRVPYPVVSVHPGVAVGTGMLQHMGVLAVLKQVWIAARWELRSFLAMQSIPEAAATQTWAALEPSERLKEITGSYLNGNKGRPLGAPDEPSELGRRGDLADVALDFAQSFFGSDPKT